MNWSLRFHWFLGVLCVLGVVSWPDRADAQPQSPKTATEPTVPPQKHDFGRIPTDPVPGQVITGFRRKQNLTALPEQRISPKKTAEGWPDLTGAWSNGGYIGGATHSIITGFDPASNQIEGFDQASTSGGVGWPGNVLIEPMKGVIPYQPWAQEKHMGYLAKLYTPTKRMDQEPTDLCFPGGVPHDTFSGVDIRYIPGAVVFLRPKNTQVIPVDDRPRLSDDITLFMGDSRGHFEGDTLVVETRNNRDTTWFDTHGTFHSSAMRVIERFTLVDDKTMYHEITIDDPAVFTQVWRMATTFDRGRFDPVARENQCHESERDMDAVTRQGLRANAAGIRGYHIDIDLKTGRALRPEEQPYLDRGQVPFHSFAPAIPDEMLAGKVCDGCPSKSAEKPHKTTSKSSAGAK